MYQTETEVTYVGKVISDIFLAIDTGHGPRNGIWNDSVGLVTLSVCISIDLKGFRTENNLSPAQYFEKKKKKKTHVNTEYERETMAAASVLALRHYQVMRLMRIG